jgi:DNA-binding transcriptional ArsR family regulator
MEAVQPELAIDNNLMSSGRRLFRAINHPLRQRIIELIHKSRRITVTDLYRKLNIEQSVASQHLAILRHERFLKTTRHKRFVFYSVDYKRIEEVQEISLGLLDYDKKKQRASV